MANDTKEVIILELQVDDKNAKQADKSVDALTDSIVALRKANKELRAERDLLSTSDEEGAKRIQEINEQINKNTKIIKENSSEVEKNRLNVGNYKNSIVAAWKETKKLEAANLALIKSQSKVNTSTIEGREEFDKLQKEIEENTKAIEEHNKSIKENIDNTEIFGTSIGNLKQGFAALTSPIGAVTAGLTALVAGYIKSSTGAKDFAFAQDRINFIMSKTIEMFGQLVGGGNGEGGSGPLSKLITLWGKFLQYAPGINLLFRDQIDSLLEESEAAALAAENLRKLQIEQQRAGNAAKTFESAAETWRRIRDDQTKSYEERLKAIDAINQNINASGTVRINVLKQEIEAIKEANANWKNQDNLVVEIESKRREIADIEEEINGKRTENIMALNALQKEQFDIWKAGYDKDLSDYEKAQNERIALTQERIQIELDYERKAAEMKLKNYSVDLGIYLSNYENTTGRITQIAKEGAEALQKNIDASNKEKIRKEQESALKQIQIDEFKNDALIAGINYVTKERSAARVLLNTLVKADAIKETIINTAAAAVAAYRALAEIKIIGPILGTVAAAAVVAFGAVKVAQISGITFARGGVAAVSKFANGGKAGVTGGKLHSQGGTKYYGTDGNVVELERGENWYVLNRSASREINHLSSINKKNGGASFDVSGYRNHFATGGMVITKSTSTTSGDLSPSTVAMIEALVSRTVDRSMAGLPPIYVVAQDVSNVNNKADNRRNRAKVL